MCFVFVSTSSLYVLFCTSLTFLDIYILHLRASSYLLLYILPFPPSQPLSPFLSFLSLFSFHSFPLTFCPPAFPSFAPYSLPFPSSSLLLLPPLTLPFSTPSPSSFPPPAPLCKEEIVPSSVGSCTIGGGLLAYEWECLTTCGGCEDP